MSTLVNIHQAKTQLSKLLRRVEAGEEIIIGRAGQPIARLTRFIPEDLTPRPLGAWRGQVEIGDDFDTLPDEVVDAFYTSQIEPPAENG